MIANLLLLAFFLPLALHALRPFLVLIQLCLVILAILFKFFALTVRLCCATTNKIPREASKTGTQTRILEAASSQAESNDSRAAVNAKINNPWEILGVSPGATTEQIRKAYLSKLRAHHPDLFFTAQSSLRRQAHEKTIAINEAYKTITATYGNSELAG